MTAYDVRISDWSSDVCSSDLHALDQVLVPRSGGGLVSGCALALATLSPETRVHPVEPAGFDDMKRSLEAGRRVANERTTEIGKATCRESVGKYGEITVLALTVIKRIQII